MVSAYLRKNYGMLRISYHKSIAGLLTQDSINVEMSLSLTLDKSFAPETNPVIEYGDSVTLIEKMMEIEDNSTSCSSCDATFLECGGYSAE